MTDSGPALPVHSTPGVCACSSSSSRSGNRRPPPASDSDSTDSETQERLVGDPLQATPTELSAGLRAMTRELRRPNGESYPPDIIHYVLLGEWGWCGGEGRGGDGGV